MRALEFDTAGQPLRVIERPEPVAQAGDVILKVAFCGICGSDVHATEPSGSQVGKGTILGHEFSGEVVHSADPAWKVGDRAIGVPLLAVRRLPAAGRLQGSARHFVPTQPDHRPVAGRARRLCGVCADRRAPAFARARWRRHGRGGPGRATRRRRPRCSVGWIVARHASSRDRRRPDRPGDGRLRATCRGSRRRRQRDRRRAPGARRPARRIGADRSIG